MKSSRQSPAARPGVGLAACVFELAADAREVQVLPAGRFKAIDGRPHDAPGWYIDGPLAARVIEQINARANDIVIDYEHQTLNAPENGQAAPAAGWAKKFEWREGQGLYAVDVGWTDKAKAHIAAREYRYISPVFEYDKKTGAVRRILMLALTNYPAIDGMDDLASRAAARFSTSTTETDSMNELLKKLLAQLGLKDDATEDQALSAVASLKAKNTELETAVAAARAEKPDPKKYVPIETVTELQTQVASLSATINAREVDEVIKGALEQGRILPAMEGWARDLGKKDLAALKAYVENAQPIAALAGTQSGGKKPEKKDGELSEEELAVCRSMGLSEEEYKKNRPAAAA